MLYWLLQDVDYSMWAFKNVSALSSSGVEMSLYGSTVSGFALKDSDLNIDVTMAKSPLILKDVFLVLRDDESGNWPSIILILLSLSWTLYR